jgi:ammonia channel protein AmtB
VAVGASADMMFTPFGAILVGTLTGVLSTLGYQFISGWITKKFKITDTCGVNNLHGMPSVLGGLLSVLMSALASYQTYDLFNEAIRMDTNGNLLCSSDPTYSSLHEIFPRDGKWELTTENNMTTCGWVGDEEFWGTGGWSAPKQAGRQFAAMIITMAFAVIGGLATGLLMKWIARFQTTYKKGATVAHLALNISNAMVYHAHPDNLPKELLFDDNAFFYQSDSEDEEDLYKHITPNMPDSNGVDNDGYKMS